jgi:hypothetical protein
MYPVRVLEYKISTYSLNAFNFSAPLALRSLGQTKAISTYEWLRYRDRSVNSLKGIADFYSATGIQHPI